MIVGCKLWYDSRVVPMKSMPNTVKIVRFDYCPWEGVLDITW